MIDKNTISEAPSVYESIVKGLTEAVEFEKGAVKARRIKCTVADLPNFTPQEIKDVRISLEMTQSTFAAVMGVSQKTVEAWECGTNVPIGVARRMLGMLKADKSIPAKYNIIK